MEKVKIAIVDTMVKLDHPALKLFRQNIKIRAENVVCSDIAYNHATAICGEILKKCPCAHIDVYPLFNAQHEADPSDLLEILDFILKNENYDIINLSLGTSDGSYFFEFDRLCTEFQKKGTIIVAAFDNFGSMTYPACISSVIGIDMLDEIKGNDEFYFIEGAIVNIICAKKQRAVLWDEPDTILSFGTSFWAGYITGIIGGIIGNGEKDIESVLGNLKKWR